MNIKYELPEKSDDGEVNRLSGYIVFTLLPWVKRVEAVKHLGIKITQEGSAEMTDMVEKGCRLVDIALPQIKEVKVKNVEGFEFKDAQELLYDEAGTALLQEIGNKVVGGVKLSPFLLAQ